MADIDGTDGDDTISGSGSGQSIDGKGGNDSIVGGSGNDELKGDAGDDTLHGGDGNDKLDGGEGNDSLEGGAGNDTLAGGKGANFLRGGDGDDEIVGEKQSDTIAGGDGDDLIDASDGDDIIAGNRGNDTIKGGKGADTFVYREGDGADTIQDFLISEGDRIAFDVTYLQSFQDVQGRMYASGNGTLISRSDGGSILLTGVQPSQLSAANFLFNAGPICLADDTEVLTDMGWRAIGLLERGSLVVTVDHGLQPVQKAIRQNLRFTSLRDKANPILVPPQALGLRCPERPLVLSPQHRVLVPHPEYPAGVLVAAVKLCAGGCAADERQEIHPICQSAFRAARVDPDPLWSGGIRTFDALFSVSFFSSARRFSSKVRAQDPEIRPIACTTGGSRRRAHRRIASRQACQVLGTTLSGKTELLGWSIESGIEAGLRLPFTLSFRI
jgi:hypothetical protein